MRRLARHLLLAACLLLLAAPAALAESFPDHGQGTYGPVSDKVTTNAGFIIIGFFALFALFATLLQNYLDNRKKRRKAAKKARLANAQWHGGW